MIVEFDVDRTFAFGGIDFVLSFSLVRPCAPYANLDSTDISANSPTVISGMAISTPCTTSTSPT